MMAPVELLDKLQADGFPHLDHLIHQLDLIDVSVNLTGPAEVGMVYSSSCGIQDFSYLHVGLSPYQVYLILS